MAEPRSGFPGVIKIGNWGIFVSNASPEKEGRIRKVSDSPGLLESPEARAAYDILYASALILVMLVMS